jgi:hypothetical protein
VTVVKRRGAKLKNSMMGMDAGYPSDLRQMPLSSKGKLLAQRNYSRNTQRRFPQKERLEEFKGRIAEILRKKSRNAKKV